jgi:hypothetical protein
VNRAFLLFLLGMPLMLGLVFVLFVVCLVLFVLFG